jgi:CTP synthase
VCGLKDAHTTEVDPATDNPVVDILPDQVQKLREKQYGSSMRLGNYESLVTDKESLLYSLYGEEAITERHRHRYEVNPSYKPTLREAGLRISAESPDHILTEVIELPGHPFFIATQFHPEFKSRPLNPHPLFLGLVEASMSTA